MMTGIEKLVAEWKIVVFDKREIVLYDPAVKFDMTSLCYGFMLAKGLDAISAAEMVAEVDRAKLL
ncbi:hypothetical protein WJ93_08560 [Burkholderia ubonensis]|nr:hypothetical protein WJ93_08560 [Burkholderia ubonensis]